VKSRCLKIVAVAALCLAAGGPALAQSGLTKEQGEAILNELRQIRLLLERQPRPAAVQPAPAAAPRVRVSVTPGRDWCRGREDAPLTLVEFSDYQCPFCKRFYATTFGELKRDYIDTGRLRYVSRDLPLANHPQARLAAKAARCAGG